MNIIYFIDNKLGGVTSLNYNLAAHVLPGIKQTVIHIQYDEWNMSKADVAFPVDKEIYFHAREGENYYTIIKRLRNAVPDIEGALLLNYDTEMSMLDNYAVRQTTYQLVHDHWNLGLAKKFGHVSDVFICHNTVIFQELKSILPGRESDIFYLPHGVKIPLQYRQRTNEDKKLQLLFLGRMTERKGVFDLPVINELLRRNSVEFEWTCIGNGPDLAKLKQVWNPLDKVRFFSPASNEEVLAICAGMDVFVLPTKFEGSPVSLLETMSAGVVPVITDLPGGITDIVNDDIGYRIAMDDNEGFARAIAGLYNNRELLDSLSTNCRKKIVNEFDVTKTAKAYHELFLRYKDFYKVKKQMKIKLGARLDHPLIPSSFSKAMRKLTRRAK